MITVEGVDTLSLARAAFSAQSPSNSYANSIAASLRTAGSSLFWATRLLPPWRREAIYALYAFWREVDDIADGDASPALKNILLADWRTEIALLYAGSPQHPVTRALNEAVRRCSLQCRDFLAIIDGVEMKARGDIRAPSVDSLDLYCERVAVAVARLSIRIFGEETPAGERVAAALGRAVQFTGILGNLAEDARRHCLYLPREVLQAHSIHATTPSWVLAQPAHLDVCRDVAMLAERHYSRAADAMMACPRAAMRPAAIILAIHRAILHELLARGWRHLDEPVRIPAWRKLALALRHGLAGR